MYADQVKPYGRLLRKRIVEQAEMLGLGQVEVDEAALRQACICNQCLHIVQEEAGEWVCYMHGKQVSFIDATDPKDCYPPELWQAFEEYLEYLANFAGGADEEKAKLPGGRYACAKELKDRNLYFLQGRPLGQICHIVQLAISQKHLLGHTDMGLVPYRLSHTAKKHASAKMQKAVPTRGNRPVATMDDVVRIMQVEMQKAWIQAQSSIPPQEPSIPLSNIKRIFRGSYKMDLSETFLGCSKVSELFENEPRLRNICSVKLREHGYVVTAPQPVQVTSPPSYPQNLFTGYTMPAGYSPTEPMATSAPMPASYSPASSYEPPPPGAPPYSAPAYVPMPTATTGATEDQFVDVASETNHEDMAHGPTPPVSEAGYGIVFSQSEDIQTQSEQSSPASTSKSSWRRPLLSEDFGADNEAEDAFPGECPSPPKVGQRPAFSQFGGAHPLSPSQLGKEGGIGQFMRGTFINFKPPPSPAHGKLPGGHARIRARSLPKDIGSPKSDFEVACHSLNFQHQPVSTPGSEGNSPTRQSPSRFNKALTLATIGDDLDKGDQEVESAHGFTLSASSTVAKRKGSRTRRPKAMIPEHQETPPKRHSDPPRADLRLNELL
jgi:hypothetical protein